MFRKILSTGLNTSPTADAISTDKGDVGSGPKRKAIPKELVINDTPHAVLFSLLEFIYTDSTHITPETAQELLISAIQFELPR